MEFWYVFIEDLDVRYFTAHPQILPVDLRNTHLDQAQVILLVIVGAFVLFQCNSEIRPSFCRFGYLCDV